MFPLRRPTQADHPAPECERVPELLDELVTRVARNRDRDAFRVLFQHFAPRLKTFYLRRGLDDGTAEDLTQEAMLRLWHRAAQFDPSRATLSTWIYAIARNLRADALRRDLRQAPELDLPEPCVPEASPEAAAIRAQWEIRLHAALRDLPAAQKEAVRAAYFGDLSHGDAHQMLGVALGTLKSRLRLALDRLRAALGGPA